MELRYFDQGRDLPLQDGLNYLCSEENGHHKSKVIFQKIGRASRGLGRRPSLPEATGAERPQCRALGSSSASQTQR